MKKTLREQVREFHDRVLRTESPSAPTVPDQKEVRVRLRLIAEEFCELLESVIDLNCEGAHLRAATAETMATIRSEVDAIVTCGPIRVDLPELADALGDLDYVIEGTRQAFGIDGGPVADEIHRTNMAKINGRIVNGKLQKPEGWRPPDIAAILKAQGWKP